jgi:hypothetical protein
MGQDTCALSVPMLNSSRATVHSIVTSIALMRENASIPGAIVMSGYREGFVKLLYGIILAQFIVIAILLGGFSTTYLSNDYFRIWVNNSFPGLGLLLTGEADTLLIGMAIGGTVLLIQQMKRGARVDEKTETTAYKSSSPFTTGELLPDHATQMKDIEAPTETPQQVLGELEKQDF